MCRVYFENLIILLSAALWVNITTAAEEAAPEIFLPPRNFNPHPYELGYDPSQRHPEIYENQVDPYIPISHNRGPVLFPANRDNEVRRFTPRDDHPVNRHPYAFVAKKKKQRAGFSRYEENVNPQVYKALAAHGAKVLKIPHAEDLRDAHFDPSYSDQKKRYAFSYKVVDHLTGDDFSHTQSQNAQSTNGEYRVKLPDGRLQIVSYTADKDGYKADVKYTENEVQIAKPNVINQHNYPQHNYINNYDLGAKQIVYDDNLKHRVQLYLPDKYQIAPPESDVQLFARQFIASTLAPYANEEPQIHHPTSSRGNKYEPIYVDAHGYKIQRSLHHYKK